MEPSIAKHLIQTALQAGEKWADLGAGSGTFSLALAELLGPQGEVIALDREGSFSPPPRNPTWAPIQTVTADFRQPMTLPLLDGILMANSLHFIKNQLQLGERLLDHLQPDGSFLLIEYDRRFPSPWVPYPLSRRKGEKLFQNLGLGELKEIGRTPSQYGNGDIYALWGRKK